MTQPLMRARRAVAACLLLAQVCQGTSCGPSTGPDRVGPPSTPPAPRAEWRTEPRPRPRAADLRTIHALGVGDVHLGKPLPGRCLAADTRPESLYFARMYMDAQTLEGLRLRNPAVMACFEKGPFHHWFETWSRRRSPAGDDPKKKFAPPRGKLAVEAVRKLRGGAPITLIVIDAPGAKTAKGIGVGSTLKDIVKAYGQVKPLGTPPSFGNDECVVKLPGLPAYLHFKTCNDAKLDGRVTRIMMWKSRTGSP